MTATAPRPKELANTLRSLANTLEAHGDRALELAPLLAARGWPTTTLGTGSRSSNELTSVEAAADNPNIVWDDVDLRLLNKAHQVWVHTLDLRTLITNIVTHAGTDKRTNGGTGDCLACTRFVPGTAVDRLRGGYCDGCRKAWERAGRPDRVTFQRARRRELDQLSLSPQKTAG